MLNAKKILALILALMLCLSLAACGSGNDSPSTQPSKDVSESAEPTDTPEPEETSEPEREVPGTYESVSLFQSTTYEWHDNGSYDRTNPEEKGTYSVSDKGDVVMSENGGSGGDTFTPHGDYYYRSNLICEFEKDDEYGLAPTFDDNGHSTQTFDAFYERITNDRHHYVWFQMNEDGTFTLKDMIRSNTQGIVDKGQTYEGTYTLNGDVLMLKWRDIECPFLYLDGKIYFDVIEKRTDANSAKLDAKREAVAAAREERWAPVDDGLSAEVSAQLQGEWQYTDGAVRYTLNIDGYNIQVTGTTTAGSIVNQGTYTVCKDDILITYENGGRASMAYTYENGQLDFYAIQGVED